MLNQAIRRYSVINFLTTVKSPTNGLSMCSLYATRGSALLKVLSSNSDKTVLSVSLDEAAVEQLGDPINVSAEPPGRVMEPGTVIARVSWEAYSRGESDELYHARWANIYGEFSLSLPLSVRVLQCHSFPAHDLLNAQDSRPWILDVEVESKSWRAVLAQGELRQLAP